MRVEHIGINIPEPVKAAEWYQKNLGMQVKSKMDESPYVYFICDSEGHTMFEIYNNPAAPVPDYKNLHHLTFHIAFYTDDIKGTWDRLIEAGATAVNNPPTENLAGDQLAMMRDPWGMAIQLAKREKPMI